jgi:hypothetical protein
MGNIFEKYGWGLMGGIPRWREAHFIRWTITLGIWGMEVLWHPKL